MTSATASWEISECDDDQPFHQICINLRYFIYFAITNKNPKKNVIRLIATAALEQNDCCDAKTSFTL